MSEATKVAITLSARAFKSTVVINGVDVSGCLFGVEVSAFVDSVTSVKLFMRHVDVEIDGEPSEVLRVLPEAKQSEG